MPLLSAAGLRRRIAVPVVAALACAAPALGIVGATPAVAATPAPTTAIGAGALINSVGVNVHMYYDDTSYADSSRVLALLQQLGVHHVRDVLADDRPDEVAALTMLGRAGIDLELVLPGTGFGPTLSVDPDQLAELRQLAPYVSAVEPTNEDDCSGDPSWNADLHAYAASLTDAIQGDPQLAGIPVLAPSFCDPDSVAAYGSVAGTAELDNSHDYAGTQAPEDALEGRLPQFEAVQDASNPEWVTETGYTNATAPGAGGVTNATAASYLLRTVLDDARLGVARTYLYELLDEKPDPSLTLTQEHFGLATSSYAPKPAFTALRALLADVANGASHTSATSAAVAPYPVTVSGGGSLLRTLTVTDPNGRGETEALWLAVPLENPATHQTLPAQSAQVQVSVAAGGPAVTALERRPASGNAAVALGSGRSFQLPVDGQVTLVHLGPAPVTETARTTAAAATTSACVSRQSYSQLGASWHALVQAPLTAVGWAGSPRIVGSGLPAGVRGAVAIAGTGQLAHVAVAGAPSRWTVAVWERTAATSASYATFLHVTGAPGALLRTYDLADDPATHYQVSGFGLPTAGALFGQETWGQSMPGTWHLLTLTDTGSQLQLGVDGMVVGAVPAVAFPLTGLDLGSVTQGFAGTLAGLQVYGHALAPSTLFTLATSATETCPSQRAQAHVLG